LNKKDGYESDSVLTLEPTSPFRSPELIERCIALFKDPGVDSAIGVTETRSNYGKIVNGKFEYLFPGQPRRRQDRQPLYMESSTIYATRTDVLRKKKSVLGDKLAR
jgi:CMP-N,N'-diacetyllegionaminic acid synthase